MSNDLFSGFKFDDEFHPIAFPGRGHLSILFRLILKDVSVIIEKDDGEEMIVNIEFSSIAPFISASLLPHVDKPLDKFVEEARKITFTGRLYEDVRINEQWAERAKFNMASIVENRPSITIVSDQFDVGETSSSRPFLASLETFDMCWSPFGLGTINETPIEFVAGISVKMMHLAQEGRLPKNMLAHFCRAIGTTTAKNLLKNETENTPLVVVENSQRGCEQGENSSQMGGPHIHADDEDVSSEDSSSAAKAIDDALDVKEGAECLVC